MKQLRLTFLFFLLLTSSGQLTFAQQSVNAAGAESVNANGQLSFSIGEIFYISKSSSENTLSEGVQQAYNISEVAGIRSIDLNLNINIYPNPSSDKLTIQLDSFIDKLTIQLTDIEGKLIANQSIMSDDTSIEIQNLSTGLYLLSVYVDMRLYKTFKIIKTD
jgi:hypothetical protein